MKKSIIVGAVGLVAAAGLVGGGTFAQFTDEETTETQSVSTGSVDIAFSEFSTANSVPLNVTNAKPGDTEPTKMIHVVNEGSLPVTISTKLLKVADADDSCTEPELAAEADCDTDTDGELDEVMELNINGFVYGGETLGGLAVGESELVNGPTQSGADSIFTLAAGADRYLSIDYLIPASAGTEIQTDSVQFDVVFEAVQQ